MTRSPLFFVYCIYLFLVFGVLQASVVFVGVWLLLNRLAVCLVFFSVLLVITRISSGFC